MKPEDLTFKLLIIQIPTASGRTVNRIIIVDSKRSIIQIRNKDTIRLARSIVVSLSVKDGAKLQDISINNLTQAEIRKKHTRRQT